MIAGTGAEQPSRSPARTTARHTGVMADVETPTAASLSALSAQVAELGEHAGRLAEASDRPPTEGVAGALFDAERALRTARRSLARAERALP